MTDPEHVGRILEEWQARRLAGEGVDRAELARTYPECAAELLERLVALDALDLLFDAPVAPVPTEIGDFRIEREIGRGAMGVVYEAEQTSMQRRVALKVLTPSLTGAKRSVRRFQREAQAAGRLHHTNIVPVHAMGHHAGYWYYAMELVHGRSLSALLAEMGRTDPRERLEHGWRLFSTSATDTKNESSGSHAGNAWFRRIAEMFAAVADALQAVHDESVVHRDIKPSNLLLDADGVLKIVDFGLAHLDDPGPSMTMTGDMVGTPAYMSPEQAHSKRIPIDHRTDIYSLGATLYEVLALRPPFDGATLRELCAQIESQDPVLLRRVDDRIPRDLETIVCKAMEKDRAKRYQRAADFAQDLRQFALGALIAARRIGPLARAWRKVRRHKVRSALVAAVLVLAGTGAVLARQVRHEAELRTALQYAQLVAAADQAALACQADTPGPGVDEARSLLSQAIAIDPERPQAYLARALMPGAPIEERLADIESAGERGLSMGTVHAAQAYLFTGVGDWRRAEEAQQQAADHPVVSAADALLMGSVRSAKGEADAALILFSQAIEEAAAGTTVDLMARHRRARLRVRAGDFYGALEDLHGLRAAGDDSSRLDIRIAAVLRRLDDPEVAEGKFEEAVERARELATVIGWSELAAACRESGTREWYSAVAAEAHGRHPNAVALVLEDAWATGRRYDFEESLRLAEAALALDPNYHSAREARAHALQGRSLLPETLEAYGVGLEQKPDCLNCRIGLGSALAQSGDGAGARRQLERAIELDPWSVGAHTQLGLALTILGDFDSARASYETALRLDPEHANAHLNYGALLANKLDRPDEALECFDRALAIEPDLAEAHANRAVVLRRSKEFKAACAAAARAVECATETKVSYHVMWWKLLAATGQHDERQAALERVAETDPPELSETDHLRGHALHELRRLPEAHAVFERLQAARSDVETNFDLALVLEELGRPADAVESYRRVLAIDSRHWRALENLAGVLAKVGQFADAIDACEQAAKLAPKDPSPHVKRGAILQDNLHRSADAVEAFRKAIELDPTLQVAWRNLGIALSSLNRTDEAEEAFDRALAIGPDEAWLFFARGRARITLGRCDEAVDDLETALQLGDSKPRLAFYHSTMADALSQLGEVPRAITARREAVRLMPESPMHMNGLAWELVMAPSATAEDHREAVELARKVTSLAPGVAMGWNTYGAALYRVGDDVRCLTAIERSMLLTGDREPCDWFVRALAEHRSGDTAAARTSYDQGVQRMQSSPSTDPHLPIWRDAAAKALGR